MDTLNKFRDKKTGATYGFEDSVARQSIEELRSQIDGGLAVTGAKVGQTVKISAVDENGIPTAWEPVEFPGEGEYEPIEAFETTEDVQAIYKDIGENKAITAILKVPTGSELFYIQVYTRHKSGRTLRVVLKFSEYNTTLGARMEVYPKYGYFTGTGYQPSAAYSNSGTPIALPNDTVATIPENDPIVRLEIVAYGNKTIPSGTYICCLGVRA